MVNKKEERQPTQKAIEAHQRGKDDAKRAQLLADQRKLTPKQLTALVTEYAEVGDAFHSATKFGITVPELRRLFDRLGINDVIDARKVLAKGLLAETVDGVVAQEEAETADLKAEDSRRQSRLDELEVQKNKVVDEAVDLADRQAAAALKNKEAAARLAALEAEQYAQQVKEERFTIPETRVGEFKKTVLFGVSAAQRRFGGSRKEILAEIKRLLPEVDVDVLAR